MSGFICAPMPAERADRLDLPPMVATTRTRGTAYTVSVDAADGVSHRHQRRRPRPHPPRAGRPRVRPTTSSGPGTSCRCAPSPAACRARRPHRGRRRPVRLAGLEPVGAIAEIVADDGTMMRAAGAARAWPTSHGLPVEHRSPTSSPYRRRHETACERVRRANVAADQARRPSAPSPTGTVTGADHLALVAGGIADGALLVRVHSECLTGERFGSLRCECGPQLDAALERSPTRAASSSTCAATRAAASGSSTSCGLRAAGRRPRHRRRQPRARPARRRPRLRAAAAILADLGVHEVRLLTNNPDKVTQLRELGIDVAAACRCWSPGRRQPTYLRPSATGWAPARHADSTRPARRRPDRDDASMSGNGAPVVHGRRRAAWGSPSSRPPGTR